MLNSKDFWKAGVLGALALGLAGCAQYQWVHPTANADDFERDKLACTYQARLATANASSTVPRSYGDAIVSGIAIGVERNDLAVMCMKTRGYAQAPLATAAAPAGLSSATKSAPPTAPAMATPVTPRIPQPIIRQGAEDYCNSIFKVRFDKGMMASFDNDYDKCVTIREKEMSG